MINNKTPLNMSELKKSTLDTTKEEDYENEDENEEMSWYREVWCDVGEHSAFIEDHWSSIPLYTGFGDCMECVKQKEMDEIYGTPPCNICGGDKENGIVKVGGVWVTLCEHCDIDGSNYNGWNDEEVN